MMTRLRFEALLGLLLGAAGGCGYGFRGNPPESPRTMLTAEIRHGLEADSLPFEEERLRIEERGSEVWPELEYHWGLYRVRTSHGWIIALVAEIGEEHIIIRTLADWQQVWGSRLQLPESVPQAVKACYEIVSTTNNFRGPVHNTELYGRGSDLSRLTLVNAAALGLSANLPSTTRVEGGWNVDLWQIQPGRSVKYRCLMTTDRIEYMRLDSLPGTGFLPR